MQDIVARLRNSASLKVAVIGFLVLVLLIPLAMIENVVADRGRTADEARSEVAGIWGGQQLIAGPVLVVPYEVTSQDKFGNIITERRNAYVLPRELDISATVTAETRYRGLYEVPVYRAEIRIEGILPALEPEQFNFPVTSAQREEIYALVSVSDARALTGIPEMSIGGQTVPFVPSGHLIESLPAPIAVPLGPVFTAGAGDTDLPFSISMNINGTKLLRFLPLGDTTTVSLSSSWPSPSFVGSYLPTNHDIGPDGFRAQWRVSSIGRALPSQWTEGHVADGLLRQSAFGMQLYVPVDLYRLTTRAARYGILFICLSFASYFLFEAVLGLRLHPLQYLLVGFANALFFLLLVSLAEHVGFGPAYLVSAAASCVLISGYSRTVLGKRRRAAVIGAVLLLLYTFLYMTLRAETYALLTGSLGLWVALALVMYLTRRIEWYDVGTPAGRQRNLLDDS